MEEQIAKTNSVLKRFYIVFWLLPILICIAGEFNLLPTGSKVDSFRSVYISEVTGILLTAALVPVSLKLFHWMLINKLDSYSFPDALKRYGRLSIIRLAMLALVVVFNLISYYLILSTTCILCACIGLSASLFCIPSDRRLREELHINKEKE
jgi:hypothetical protein